MRTKYLIELDAKPLKSAEVGCDKMDHIYQKSKCNARPVTLSDFGLPQSFYEAVGNQLLGRRSSKRMKSTSALLTAAAGRGEGGGGSFAGMTNEMWLFMPDVHFVSSYGGIPVKGGLAEP